MGRGALGGELNKHRSNCCAVADDQIRAAQELHQAKMYAGSVDRNNSIVERVKAFDVSDQGTWAVVVSSLRGVTASELEDDARELLFETAAGILTSPKLVASEDIAQCEELFAVVKACASVVDATKNANIDHGSAIARAAVDMKNALHNLALLDGDTGQEVTDKKCEPLCSEPDACLFKVNVAINKSKSLEGCVSVLRARVKELHASVVAVSRT